MKLPSKTQWECFFQILSKKEKFFFLIFSLTFFTSLSFLISTFYLQSTFSIPKAGGIFIEGKIGQPKFLNPIFANSQIDRDLTFLLFSPLFKIENGKLIPVLAESVEILEGGKIYKVKLKDNIFWENGEKITPDDVIFTVTTIQDKKTQSPFRESWLGVETEKISDSTLLFKLKAPSGVFFENLTLRPISKNYFKEIPNEEMIFSEKNLHPLASGIFRLGKINFKRNGEISSLELLSNKKYFGEKPKIEKIVFTFFENKENLLKQIKNGLIDGVLEEVEGMEKQEFLLPRYVGLFFNLKNEILKEKPIREAISLAIDKKKIVKEILNGKAKIVNSPLLNDFFEKEEKTQEFSIEKANQILDQAGFFLSDGKREKKIKNEEFHFTKNLKVGSRGEEVKRLQECLSKFPEIYPSQEISGYFGNETKKAVILLQEKYKDEILKPMGLEKGTGEVGEKTREKLNQVCFEKKEEKKRLEFSLVTVKNEIFQKVAEEIKSQLEKLGIGINLKVLELEEMETKTIPKKDYELLLFGMSYGKIVDPYPFWHSSQIEEGLNLSNFENEKVDQILLSARQEPDLSKREKLLEEFEKIILEEKPAVFLFNPKITYSTSKKIKGVEGGKVLNLEERFSKIENWYIKEKRVFKKWR